MKDESYVAPPSALLALTEAHRTFIEVVSLSLSHSALRKSPRGDGHAVMVLPGFFGDDGYNTPLRRFLSGLGYSVYGWAQGRNLGPRDGVLESLEERLEFVYREHGGPVSLIGHSLGGIFARELARELPDYVRQVISLGSPFGEGRLTASHLARVFSRLNPPEELTIDQEVLAQAPPVPNTAIYSRGDGVVNWKTSVQVDGHAQSESIRIVGSHCGMTMNPTAWFLMAERLAQEAQNWQPFKRSGWTSVVYPAAV
ncbi:MAG: pimeloyl-ACP methyl ester carboxylesterase [Halioglobus sp.]